MTPVPDTSRTHRKTGNFKRSISMTLELGVTQRKEVRPKHGVI